MRLFRTLTLGFAGSAAAIALAAQTHAAPLPVAGLLHNPANGEVDLLSDNSADYYIDVNDNNSVDPGDIFFAIAGINSINGTAIGAGTQYNELTVLTAEKIVSGPTNPFTNTQGIPMGTYLATPLTAADATYFDWGTGKIDVNGDSVTDFTFTPFPGVTNDGKNIAVLLEDSAQDYTREGTVQEGLTTASNGDPRASFTLDTTVDPTDTLVVTAPQNISNIGLLPPLTFIQGSSIFLNGTLGQDLWPGVFFLSDDVGSGNSGFSSPSASSSWPVFDNIDYRITAAVPEPGTLVLMGLGLLGLGGLGRRAIRS